MSNHPTDGAAQLSKNCLFSGATYCLKYELVIFAEKSSAWFFQDFCCLQNEIDYEFCVVIMLISLENRIRSQFRFVNSKNPEKSIAWFLTKISTDGAAAVRAQPLINLLK